MRKKSTMLLMLLSMLIMLCVLGAELMRHIGKDKIALGLIVVGDEELLAGKVKRSLPENPGVCFEQMILPYDGSTNRLYLSQVSETDEWTGTLTAADKGYTLYAVEDDYWEKKQEAIRDNHLFTIWMVGKEDYYELQLVVTGLPVLAMNNEYVTEPEPVEYEVDPDAWAFEKEPYHHGSLQLFNPGVGTSKYEITRTGVVYQYKGASTKSLPKKNYNLDLLNYYGENLDLSLLGMQRDNSWKLNALNTDVTRVREKTASQLWEAFDNADSEIKAPGPKMEYVELLIDNEYMGLYCLVEAVNSNKLDLDKNDILYKVVDWSVPTLEDIAYSAQRNWKVAYPIRIRYPKNSQNYAAAWQPISEYLNVFYYAQETDVDRALEMISLGNFIDKHIFTMVTSANDNAYKNTYYAVRREDDGSYKMYQIPWDLDYTFGNIYQYGVTNNVAFDSDYTVVYEEMALERLGQLDVAVVKEAAWKRWETYRKDFLSTEAIVAILAANRDYLNRSGVIERERERWPESGVNADIKELIEYQTKRMEWLDEYFKEQMQ